MTPDELAAKCKGSVHITFNEHTTNYETLRDYLYNNPWGSQIQLTNEEKEAIITAGTICEVQFYPDTPIGSYTVAGRSLTEAMEQAESVMRQPENVGKWEI